MTQLQMAYRIAKTQNGIIEVPGAPSNPKIIEYASTTRLKAQSDEVSWCSSFVNWTYIIAGIIQNPVQMRTRLTGVYSEKTIMALYDSAKKTADLFELYFHPLEPTNSIVKMPTRSASARSWMRFSKETKTPKEGDLVVLWRVDPKSWQGHVGFYVSETPTTVAILGGNQGNKVCVQNYKKSTVLVYRTDE